MYRGIYNYVLFSHRALNEGIITTYAGVFNIQNCLIVSIKFGTEIRQQYFLGKTDFWEYR